MSSNKFVWDGEKIKRIVTQSEQKFSPKDVIDSLHQVRGQIDQMVGQLEQMESQKKMLEKNVQDASKFKRQLEEFEAKCEELQVAKLDKLTNQLMPELKERALKDVKEIIAKDPQAYTDSQKDRMPYLNLQKLLATHPKMAEAVSQHMIKKHMYEEPRFTDPFRGE